MSDARTDDDTSSRRLAAGRWVELALTVTILGLVLIFVAATFGKTSAFAQASSGRGPFFFPRIVMALLLVLTPFLFMGLRSGTRALPPARPLTRMLSLMLATAIYCYFIGILGFLISSVLFAIIVPVLLGRRDVGLLAPIALAYGAAVWLLFERVFLIILPASPWPLGF